MNRDQGWHNDRSHLIPYNDRGGFRGNRGRGDRGGFRGGRGRGRGDRGRGRGRGQNYQFGRYEAFHYRSKGPKQQAPVEHYFKVLREHFIFTFNNSQMFFRIQCWKIHGPSVLQFQFRK